MNNNRIIITVDGLAGTGKTTLAHLLAQKLGFIHLNSGLLYRSIGYLALQHNVSVTDSDQLVSLVQENKIQLSEDSEGKSALLLNGNNVTDLLHQPEVSEATSALSTIPEVRELLRPLQREAFPDRHMVVEGRDMGTVVFPDAPLKFFIKVDPEIKAKRRILQLYGDRKDLDNAKTLESLKKTIEIELVERDNRDANRDSSPTIPAKEAIIIDNSSQTLTEVVENMYHAVASQGLIQDL